MKTQPKQNDAALTKWLSAWCQFIQDLELIEGADLTAIDYQDILVKANLPRLNALLQDDKFIDLLTKAYAQLRDKVGDGAAQHATRQFLTDTCWLCRPSLNLTSDKRDTTKDPRGDLKKDLLKLNRDSIKLAKLIKSLSSSYGLDSLSYLEERLQAGNPLGFIFNRKNSWQNALPAPSFRRLSELLRCFADDINEEAALLGIAIDARRQHGGAQAGLHFAMDGLTTASIRLSAEDPREPNFALVNRAIVTLLDPSNSFDSATVRRRFVTAQKRKTRV